MARDYKWHPYTSCIDDGNAHIHIQCNWCRGAIYNPVRSQGVMLLTVYISVVIGVDALNGGNNASHILLCELLRMCIVEGFCVVAV
jgi:hypothetical protein